jgi:hypothetical protein
MSNMLSLTPQAEFGQQRTSVIRHFMVLPSRAGRMRRSFLFNFRAASRSRQRWIFHSYE